jgi:hypothetical protein
LLFITCRKDKSHPKVALPEKMTLLGFYTV